MHPTANIVGGEYYCQAVYISDLRILWEHPMKNLLKVNHARHHEIHPADNDPILPQGTVKKLSGREENESRLSKNHPAETAFRLLAQF
tara:strand:- start:570 stop:833 length:264 start_codon:yes stop_codon:yes gene_type:complete